MASFCIKMRNLFVLTSPSIIAVRMLAQSTSIPEGAKLEKTLNQVNLLGRVGSEPFKRGNEAHPLVIFSLATHANFKYESGEMSQRTDWHRICVFKPSLREIVYSYLKKGQRVHVTGRISYGSISEAPDGTPKPTTSIIADDVIFLQSSSSLE